MTHVYSTFQPQEVQQSKMYLSNSSVFEETGATCAVRGILALG
jgi:hypothetical protein